jgi:hypothetical protein
MRSIRTPEFAYERSRVRQPGAGQATTARLTASGSRSMTLRKAGAGALRAAPALLPILHRIETETEGRREARLRHAEFPADRLHVNLGGGV